MSLDQVRTIADAVLYEGYLLYPYRASSDKNRARWQFGVLGPPGAAADSFGEDPGMAMQCLLAADGPAAALTLHLRFLQLQVRDVQQHIAAGYTSVDALTVAGRSVLSWDEAVEREIVLQVPSVTEPAEFPVTVDAGEEEEPLVDTDGTLVGRIVRRRRSLTARVRVSSEADGPLRRLSVSVDNEHPEVAADKNAAIRTSLIGAHLLLEAHDAHFVSLLEPPDECAGAASRCEQRRCWPVLVGAEGTAEVVLGSPIILYDYPQVAMQSPGALFDSTEIDEILTLRVMTMTDEEKAEARATDPRAQAIIERCDGMSPADLAQLHGVLRDPHRPSALGGRDGPPDGFADLRDADPPRFDTGEVPWWDPGADASVQPEADAVMINGIRVAKGSLVRVHPTRRADAQDIFFAGQVARVTAVLSDVDGNVHVALVLRDDPAADMHEWYGRYFYFAPDEVEPLDDPEPLDGPELPDGHAVPDTREESRS